MPYLLTLDIEERILTGGTKQPTGKTRTYTTTVLCDDVADEYLTYLQDDVYEAVVILNSVAVDVSPYYERALSDVWDSKLVRWGS